MENLSKFTAKVQKFYALVESHESDIQNWIKETKKPLHSITNQSVFYRAAAPKDSLANTPFEQFEGFREDLIDNIFTSLQEEYNLLEEVSMDIIRLQLQQYRNKINAANKKLQKEQILIETSYSNLKKENLSASLNPCCPSLEHIVDWCSDIWRYYHSYYLQISHGLLNLNYEDEMTVTALTRSFREDPELKKRINKIRSFKLSQFEFII